MVGARTLFALVLSLGPSVLPTPAHAEAPPPTPAFALPAAPAKDTAAPPAAAKDGDEKPKLWFRGSQLYWDHSATLETLGVGSDYQSRNPVYEMSFGFRPRAYFFDRRAESLSARADVALVREFTNSDQTAERGEWTLTDAELWLAYVRTVNDTPGATTDLVLRAPTLLLPTSNASASNGKILGVGVGAGVEQGVPLRGAPDVLLSHATLRANAGYRYQFTRTNVPTNDELERVRLGPDGRSLPSDQLSGSAFPQHQAFITLTAIFAIHEQVNLGSDIGMRYAYRHALDDSVEVCGVVATGCTEVESGESASRYGVSTLFGVELSYAPLDELSLAVGYVNLAPQLGRDGQRRQPFYSHDARGYLTLEVALDALYVSASGEHAAKEAANARSTRF